jgi:hypothetical protein
MVRIGKQSLVGSFFATKKGLAKRIPGFVRVGGYLSGQLSKKP